MVILPHRRKAFRTAPQSGGGGGDPYFSSVILLAHMDGSNGSTTFTDSSSYARTISAIGNAQLSTSEKKFGTASLITDGTGDYAEVTASADFNFGTSTDMTVEFWLWADATDSNGCGVGQSGGGGGPFYVSVYFGVIYAGNGAANLCSFSYAGYYDQWVYVAFTRSGSTPRLFLNGTLVNTGANAAFGTNSAIRLMSSNTLAVDGKGYIDDVRITRGVARYTSSFTPPTQAFPDFLDESVDPYFENVVLSLHCDGTNGSTTFTDSSGAARTITANGNSQISTTQSKFGSSSGLFDGTGDYLSAAASADFTFGTGDYTIECWVYFNSLGTTVGLFGNGPTSSGSLNLYKLSNNRLELAQFGTTGLTSTNTFSSGQWYHVAATRSGSNLKLWVDGVEWASTTTSFNNTSNGCVIGRAFTTTDNFYLSGYIDELRITKGVARYTAAFTPPTQAFPDS